MDKNNQDLNEEEKLLEAPPEEKLIQPPEEEKLLTEHSGVKRKSSILKVALIIFGILILLSVASFAYLSVDNSSNNVPLTPGQTENINDEVAPPEEQVFPPHEATDEEQVVCTMDAKICPDGTSVGREGPNCEFAACPGE